MRVFTGKGMNVHLNDKDKEILDSKKRLYATSPNSNTLVTLIIRDSVIKDETDLTEPGFRVDVYKPVYPGMPEYIDVLMDAQRYKEFINNGYHGTRCRMDRLEMVYFGKSMQNYPMGVGN
jgi:hypothetical protein